MRRHRFAIPLLLLALPVFAQRSKLSINATTPEGQLLQQIGQEQDGARKAELMEQFIAKHEGHDGAAWVYGQMVSAYRQAGLHDKALAAGEKLLALDPADVEMAHAALKAAEAKKDPALIQKWSATTAEAARRVTSSEKPSGAEEEAAWKQKADYAQQVGQYADYALLAAAPLSRDPAVLGGMVDALQARSPKSPYLGQLYAAGFLSLRQANQPAQALALAEKADAQGLATEDMLLVLADHAMTQAKQPDRTLAYSAKLVEVMGAKPKPEGVSDADWNKRKATILGLAHWMAGVTHSTRGSHAEADRSLRTALPMVQGNAELEASTLFYLGLSDYMMAKGGKNKALMADALRFSEQSAAMKGPFQQQALKNVKVIRAESVARK